VARCSGRCPLIRTGLGSARGGSRLARSGCRRRLINSPPPGALQPRRQSATQPTITPAASFLGGQSKNSAIEPSRCRRPRTSLARSPANVRIRFTGRVERQRALCLMNDACVAGPHGVFFFFLMNVIPYNRSEGCRIQTPFQRIDRTIPSTSSRRAVERDVPANAKGRRRLIAALRSIATQSKQITFLSTIMILSSRFPPPTLHRPAYRTFTAGQS